MLSRIEVTEPPNAAPTEIEASISSDDNGSMEKVNGMRIAIATGPPSPGRTPTHKPITVPAIMNRSCFACRAALNPRTRLSSIGSARPEADLFDKPVADQPVRQRNVEQI